MKRVAVYSHNIRTLFDAHAEQGTGGAEFQLLTLAQRLQRRGHPVAFLVGDVQSDTVEERDGFTFIKCVSAGERSPFRKLGTFLKAFRLSRAYIFIERGSSTLTFWFAACAMLFGKKFVFCAASDINFALDEVDLSFTNRFQQRLYHLGLRLARSIIVQKEQQRSLVHENIHREADVVNNFVAEPGPYSAQGLSPSDVLWISNIIPYKQPELFLEAARALPRVRFRMIGGSRDGGYFQKIRDAAVAIPNLEFLGYIPAQRVGAFIARTCILANTTRVQGKYEEGFPNSFLQAWQQGVPVVSLISNPDHILGRFGIGICSGSNAQFMKDVVSLVVDPARRKQMGERGRAYVAEFHNASTIEEAYCRILGV